MNSCVRRDFPERGGISMRRRFSEPSAILSKASAMRRWCGCITKYGSEYAQNARRDFLALDTANASLSREDSGSDSGKLVVGKGFDAVGRFSAEELRAFERVGRDGVRGDEVGAVEFLGGLGLVQDSLGIHQGEFAHVPYCFQIIFYDLSNDFRTFHNLGKVLVDDLAGGLVVHSGLLFDFLERDVGRLHLGRYDLGLVFVLSAGASHGYVL